MQTQSEMSGIPVGNGTLIVRQANDIPTLAAEMARAFAAYIALHAGAILFDIDLSGGGAGNVFICQALLVPGNVETGGTRRLSSQTVTWFFAADALTLQTKENAFLGGLGGDSLWAWSAASAGDGAVFGKVFITWTPEAPGTALVPSSLFFALMPGDNAGTVAVGAPVQFPQDGPTSAGGASTRASASTFTLPATGTYHVECQVSVTEAGQLQIALNGVGLPDTVAGRATGTSQIVIDTLISAVALDVLSIINPVGNAAALTITPTAGGTHAVSATLLISQP